MVVHSVVDLDVARFVTGNYVYETGSMTGILKQLKWESLKKRRKDSRVIILYKGLKGAASIPTNYLVPPIKRTRNHDSLAFQISMAGTDIYKSRKENPQKLTRQYKKTPSKTSQATAR